MTANAPFSFDTHLLESINHSFFDSIAYQELFVERGILLKESQLFPLTRWLFKDSSEVGKLHIPQKVLGLLSYFASKKISTSDLFMILAALKYGFLEMKFDNEEIDGYLERHNYFFHLSFDEQVRLLLKHHSTQASGQEIFQHKLVQYMDMVNDYVYISKTDINGRITGASDAFLERIGYDISEILGKTHSLIRHPDVPENVYKSLWSTITKGEVWSGELKNLTKNQEVFWAEMTISPEFDFENKIIAYVAIRKDITDKKIIEEIAIRDELTGLYNRRFYREVIQNELNRLRRQHGKLVFMMLDVDYFKRYNDTYGHQEGDNVLKKIADTLKCVIKRGGDHVFRLGGEEFAVLLPDTEQHDGFRMAENIRQRIESLRIEHRMNDNSPYVTISIGLTTASAGRDLVDEESLYKTADDALYLAKKAGRNCTMIHSSGELELF